MVINHTDCGLMNTSEQDLCTRIQNRTRAAAIEPGYFHAFQNLEENVRQQLQKLSTHRWIQKPLPFVASSMKLLRGISARSKTPERLSHPAPRILQLSLLASVCNSRHDNEAWFRAPAGTI
jgi:hypothetical protein